MNELTIIIPHYNSPTTLKRLILTIPMDKNIQIIVVDDKSDREIATFERVKKEFTHAIFLKNDTAIKSAGTCRNIGLAASRGKWVLFADADDFFERDFYNVIAEYFSSESDIVFFKPTSKDSITGEISHRHFYLCNILDEYLKNKNIKIENNLRYKYVVPWSKLIKRELITNNNIEFSETTVSNDVIFSCKIGFFARAISVSEKTIYCVTSSKGSLIHTVSKELFLIRINVFIEYYNYLKSHLSNSEFKDLNLRPIEYIYTSILNNFGLFFCIAIYKKFKRYAIPVFNLKQIKPWDLPLRFYRRQKRPHYYVKSQKG